MPVRRCEQIAPTISIRVVYDEVFDYPQRDQQVADFSTPILNTALRRVHLVETKVPSLWKRGIAPLTLGDCNRWYAKPMRLLANHS